MVHHMTTEPVLTRIERPDILTVSGHYFSFADPESSVFDIFDIAHALSMLCRFNGHVRSFYSVAEHAVLVSRLAPPEHALAALHHDDAEAFIGDVTRPLKQYMRKLAGTPGPDPYQYVEQRVEQVVFERFGLDYPMPDPVRLADRVALYIEQRAFMAPHDDKWAILEGIAEAPWRAYVNDLRGYSPFDARVEFLRRHQELTGATQ
jgi:hypothetical protein